MALSRTQYYEIILEYEQRRAIMTARKEKKIQDIYDKVPKIKEIRSEMMSLFHDIALQKLNGNDNKVIANMENHLKKLKNVHNVLLQKNGFSEDDFRESFFCPDCKDTGYIDGEKCHCFRAAEIKLLYKSSNIEHALADENFDNFSLEYYESAQSLMLAKRAIRKSKQFIERRIDNSEIPGIDNIFLYGTVGTGKTFLTHCIAKELLDNSIEVLYFSAVQFFECLANLTFNLEDKSKYSFDDIYNSQVLIIDDLGTEIVNDFIKSALFSCINERIIRKKNTIISTNVSINSIAEDYSQRVYSRIIGHYDPIKLECEDIRILKAQRKGGISK